MTSDHQLSSPGRGTVGAERDRRSHLPIPLVFPTHEMHTTDNTYPQRNSQGTSDRIVKTINSRDGSANRERRRDAVRRFCYDESVAVVLVAIVSATANSHVGRSRIGHGRVDTRPGPW